LHPLLSLTLLGLLLFADLVLHPAQVLYADHSDLLAEHVPARRFLVHSWRETGELPLWCPYLFAGSPFVHDIQVGAFYPPHWPLLLLPEDAAGCFLSWSVVLHVLAAGWCMYAYAARRGLGRTGALLAACGYMFAGKWLLHLLAAGHYVTAGLAWLPLLVLLVEEAVRRGSPLRATGAGLVYGLMALGTQPQWTFYAGVFLALWTLGAALDAAGWLDAPGPRSPGRTAALLGRWLACLAWTAGLGAAAAAVQLLPTAEAAGLSLRSAGVAEDDALTGGLQCLVQTFGPAVTEHSFVLQWENRAGLGVLWAAAAVTAWWLGSRRMR
jgi:hypothetical protein